MSPPFIRRAGRNDLPDVEKLLEESALPLAGVRDQIEQFFLAREGDVLVGVVGLEIYGRDALLRSLAVRPTERSKGIGNALTRRALGEARHLGLHRLVLLTTTAERYFEKKGFRKIDRSSITGAMTHSEEFAGACPASAVCMELLLTNE